jgi:hypothetical protein
MRLGARRSRSGSSCVHPTWTLPFFATSLRPTKSWPNERRYTSPPAIARLIKSVGYIIMHHELGFVPPVTVVEGIDTVEVSNSDLTLLGHGYYGDAEAVLYDMHQLIMDDKPPDLRARTSLVCEMSK